MKKRTFGFSSVKMKKKRTVVKKLQSNLPKTFGRFGVSTSLAFASVFDDSVANFEN